MSASSPGRLDGEVVIVTGAAAGLGLDAARLFAERGALVTLVDLKGDAVEGEAEKLTKAGLGAFALGADLTDQSQVESLVATVIDRHGHVDALVNLAALYENRPIAEMDSGFWHRIVDSSLTSTLFCCQAVMPHMSRAGYGRIVNTASAAVLMGGAGWSAYCAAKAGVIGFTRVLAREVGPAGITANVIMPGMIGTEHALATLDETAIQMTIAMQCVPRLGEPGDISSAIAFLISRESGFITGQTLNVGGGMNYI